MLQNGFYLQAECKCILRSPRHCCQDCGGFAIIRFQGLQ